MKKKKKVDEKTKNIDEKKQKNIDGVKIASWGTRRYARLLTWPQKS